MRCDSLPEKMSDIRLGHDNACDAWLFSMMIDNNLAYRLNPELIASPERQAFMVHMEPDQVYLPCADSVFRMLHADAMSPELHKQYHRAWNIVAHLLRSLEPDIKARRRILEFCRFRYQQLTAQHTIIPSRLVKRLTDLALSQYSGDDDPWREKRRQATARQQEMLELPMVQQALEAMPQGPLPDTIKETHFVLQCLSTVRFFCLSAMSRKWLTHMPSAEEMQAAMRQAEATAAPLQDFFIKGMSHTGTVLFLCDADGGTVFDLAMINRLIRIGHRVIFAVKSGFHFYAPTVQDMEEDPTLEEWTRSGVLLQDTNLSKNELLRQLREYRLVIINDGTRERLNLARTSVTFSRAWKEADVILAKGWRAADILLGNSHELTRDIICYWEEEGQLRIELRRHAKGIHKLTEEDIAGHADSIIRTMRDARRMGRSVMFYSCVIGSIPGQTPVALKLARTFVDNLRKKMDNVLIINPAEHFVEGMDGDDLMYMWERVQRSGYIDVWRFQSVEDIEESFALLGQKVPPCWSGKDATFSTGCTKEMRIALSVQQQNRELQIIGPEPRLFFRRGEYGVGKYFDASIKRD